ncbi:Rha family transcriptional regulator [Lelliottia amnigena]|uniref:Rha family transcriptional regulator n=1 Tax=Lelliottia amnigena TaxID=61646 RepID=UPI001ED9642B|nr:Rha family transcriptional regulator [Lelliottia amnigena]
MNAAIAISVEAPKVFSSNGRLVTTSQSVADYFDKQHKDVLRKIDMLDCSPEFTSANFCADVQTVGIGNGAERESRCFLITKDGFMFLVMGFTGKKAARLKEAYIAKFNAMESELSRQDFSAPVIPAFPLDSNFQYLASVVGGCITEMRVIQPGEHVATIQDFIHMMRMTGWLVEPAESLASMNVPALMHAIDSALNQRPARVAF